MSDPRECGWLGCGHPRCNDRCAAVPIEGWVEWSHASKCTCGHYHDPERACVPECGCRP